MQSNASNVYLLAGEAAERRRSFRVSSRRALDLNRLTTVVGGQETDSGGFSFPLPSASCGTQRNADASTTGKTRSSTRSLVASPSLCRPARWTHERRGVAQGGFAGAGHRLRDLRRGPSSSDLLCGNVAVPPRRSPACPATVPCAGVRSVREPIEDRVGDTGYVDPSVLGVGGERTGAQRRLDATRSSSGSSRFERSAEASRSD